MTFFKGVLRCFMHKPVVCFEPFTDNIGKEFLIPASHHDEFRLEELGLDQFMVKVFQHSFHWSEPHRERFEGFPLCVSNLVMLEKLVKIEIKQQTIDK